MAAIRFFLLLVLLGGLTALLVQNWTPVLPLVFLGGQTKALPLSIWILFSVAAGVITSLFIATCFQLSSYFAQPRTKKRRRVAKTATRSATAEKNTEQNTYKTPPPKTSSSSYTASSSRQTQTPVQDDSDGWDTSASDDWDFTEDTKPSDRDPDRKEYTDRATADRTRSSDDWDYIPRDTQPRPQEPAKKYTSYDEVDDKPNDEPKSSDRPDSVYSYSSGEPKNSGVGRTESIYDAEYRVLNPPYKQQNPPASPPPPVNNRPQNNDNDDWGFMDDDDWDIDSHDNSPRSTK